MERGDRISGGKGKGFAGTIIKDTWTITGAIVETGGRWGGLGFGLRWGEMQKNIVEQQ